MLEREHERTTFPLVPRHAMVGLPFGHLPSHRRGPGSDVIGSRPYRPGDPLSTIDWAATARLSAATGRDEFVVRERQADDAPRVAIVLDRRPAMNLYPAPLPWLSKAAAVREAVAAVIDSTAAARAELAEVDFGGGEAHWLPPSRANRMDVVSRRLTDPLPAPEDTLTLSLAFLGAHRNDLPGGSFVFIFSDFLAPPAPDTWDTANRHGWDVVPVVIQDPIWEQSFPEIGGAAVPFGDPLRGTVSVARLSRGEAAARRTANAERRAQLLEELERFGFRPVLVSTSDPYEIDQAFLEWAEERRRGGRLR